MKSLSIISAKSKSSDSLVEQIKIGGYENIHVFYEYFGFIDCLTRKNCDLALFFLDRNNSHIKNAVEFVSTNDLGIPYIFCIKNIKNTIALNISKYRPSNILYEPFTAEQLKTIIEVNYINNSEMNNLPATGTEIKERVDNVEYNTLNTPVAAKKNYTFFKSGVEIIKVFYAEILYIQSDHVYVFLITPSKKIPLRAKLEDIENHLPSSIFQRIHQRYVVNIDHITRVVAEALYLENIELPLSKKYKKVLLKHMNIFN